MYHIIVLILLFEGLCKKYNITISDVLYYGLLHICCKQFPCSSNNTLQMYWYEYLLYVIFFTLLAWHRIRIRKETISGSMSNKQIHSKNRDFRSGSSINGIIAKGVGSTNVKFGTVPNAPEMVTVAQVWLPASVVLTLHWMLNLYKFLVRHYKQKLISFKINSRYHLCTHLQYWSEFTTFYGSYSAVMRCMLLAPGIVIGPCWI